LLLSAAAAAAAARFFFFFFRTAAAVIFAAAALAFLIIAVAKISNRLLKAEGAAAFAATHTPFRKNDLRKIPGVKFIYAVRALFVTRKTARAFVVVDYRIPCF
jgi:hypothetical protein